MPEEDQLRFDFGICDSTDEALRAIIEKQNHSWHVTETLLSDAMLSVRRARRRRLEQQKVRIILADFDASALLFDGRRTYHRDKWLEWRRCSRKGTSWVDYPLVGFHDADLSDPAIEQLLFRVRALAKLIYPADLRPPYRDLRAFTLITDGTGRLDDDLDRDRIVMATSAIAERNASRARFTSR